jgi:hypothetical protein
VRTHRAALRALLSRNMVGEQAAELGLLAFSGSNTLSVQKAFETGFQLKV